MPPPLTPLKRPTIGLKRDSEYLDTDDEAALSSSTKKLRVAFDPNVDVRILDDYSDKSFDLVKEEVRQSIERHIAPGDKKDDAQYAVRFPWVYHRPEIVANNLQRNSEASAITQSRYLFERGCRPKAS